MTTLPIAELERAERFTESYWRRYADGDPEKWRSLSAEHSARLTREQVKRFGFEFGNAERSRLERHRFYTDPPARYFAYVDSDLSRVTTWTGEELARKIIDREGSREWTSNMGDRRRSFRCRTPDGVVYAGVAYLSAGDYCRLRRVAS